ncbi:hypothetical protein H9638_06325 [Arthrobacter sp. Sa2BUA2]|uniref:Repeat domain-containing protein n=1 Tax=Arthrobacter pullicola TaxID=2762224 RepID=A0ABR8YGT5_9MICC|nr:zinc-dependent metalloprotease family protein [Arthrobacter pullicola]MBD8043427.1 hypothetical protein [Arthrobacter pullicola]
MKTGKLALLATLLSALTLGSLVPPAAAAEQPVQETVSPAAEAPGSEPAPAQDQSAPLQSLPSAVSDPDTAPEATVLPSPEVSLPPVEAVPSESGESSGEAEDDGYEYVPVGEGHVVPGPDSPLITEADGSVHPAVESGENEHAPSARSAEDPASMLSAVARAGNIKVTLVRATVHGNGNLVDLTAARNSISSASSYWRAMSNNRLSMSIASEKVHYSASAYANDDYATMMNKIARELKWVDNPYTALVVFVPTADLKSGGYGGILGGGWTVGGTAGRILMPAPSAFTNNVVTHEVGHVLGLLHANSLQCTNGRSDVSRAANGRWSDGACSSREYGDTTDLMGSAQYNQPVINSYFWDVGKFGNGNEVLNAGRISGSKTYTLRPWGGSGTNRAVKFTDPVSGEVYYLELRQPAGYDQYLQWGPAGNRGVKIVKADAVNTWSVFSLIIPPSTRPFAGYYNTNHAWQAGQTFTTHTGTIIRINSVTADSASVTIGTEPSIPSVADLVAIDPSGNLVNYRSNASGGFSGTRQIGTGWSGTVSAHSVDWNGDGVLDLVAQTSGGTLNVYYGYKTGGFSGPATIGEGWSGLRITVGKWAAGDSLPGVIAVDTRGRAWSYRNRSGGYLSPGSVIATGYDPKNFAITDMNKDGVPELVSTMNNGTLVSRKRTSAGAAGAQVQIGVGWHNATSIRAAVDFNGKGSRGLLATFTDGKLAYYNSNGTGWSGSWTAGTGWNGFLPLGTQRAPGPGPSIAAADIVTLTGGYLQRYAAKLNGVLDKPVRIGEGFHAVQSFHTVDWNRDGVMDVLVQWEEGTLTVFYGAATGGFASSRTVGVGWGGLTISLDRPANGLPGILGIDAMGNLRSYVNVDGVSLLQGGGIVGVGWSGLRIQVLDWDGDGISDVLAAAPNGDMRFYRRTVGGYFIQGAQTIGSGWDSMNSISVGTDLTGNGGMSLVARSKKGDLYNYAILGSGRWGTVQKLGETWTNLRIAGAR